MKPGNLLALAAILSGTPAAAQDDAPAADSAAACELHVWPADAAKSFSTLMETRWSDFATIRKYSRDPNNPLSGHPLSVALQAKALGSLDLPAMLRLPGYSVTFHALPLPSRTIRATPGRILADTPPCYAEFVTDDITFQENDIAGGVLNTTFRFRRFDGGDRPVVSFGTFITGKLFEPYKKVDMTLAEAMTQFETVFAESVTEFAASLHKSSQPRAKGRKTR